MKLFSHRRLILVLALVAAAVCTIIAVSYKPLKVRHIGSLERIMREGDLSAKVDLRDFQSAQNLYALGAKAYLQGEILVVNGQPYISYVDGDSIRTDHSFDHKASLLVYARVQEWSESSIQPNIDNMKALEKFTKELAGNNGIDTTKPFPFMLQGTINELHWHVINREAGVSAHTHEAHMAAARKGVLRNVAVVLLGFYSENHHGIFTHHSSNMHIHMKDEKGTLTAHVDAMAAGDQMTIKLPK